MSEREQLVSENFGLVHSCAAKFRGRGIEYDDLYQSGCIGLVKAADKFNPALGYQFSTYAVPVILGEIKRLFRDGGAVKVSRGLKELGCRAAKLTEEFVHRQGRDPTISELSELLKVSTEQVSEAIAASMPPVSLTVSDDDGELQTDIPIPAPEKKLTEILSLDAELKKLQPEDRKLLRLRFFQCKTQSQAATELHMTQVQVSRREKKLLLYLRERLG